MTSKRDEEMVKLQEVGAYSTKQKPNQKEGPLLSSEENGEVPQIEATSDRAQ